MARYIDADAYKKYLDENWVPANYDAIDAQPLADVAPVIHAHWTIIYESTAGVTDAKCSNCGFASLAYENDVHTDNDCHYCPCCGAKMDEEAE